MPDEPLVAAPPLRVGIGFDVHPFAAPGDGRRLVLGGVVIPHVRGLSGHSDADVVTHAVIDALFGAANLGDIGGHFPDTGASYRDADSIELLGEAARRVRSAGWVVGNVDVTVIAEAPRLAPHADLMRARIGEALGAGAAAVGLKATTSEGLGFVGRREGVAAMAVCLLLSGPVAMQPTARPSPSRT